MMTLDEKKPEEIVKELAAPTSKERVVPIAPAAPAIAEAVKTETNPAEQPAEASRFLDDLDKALNPTAKPIESQAEKIPEKKLKKSHLEPKYGQVEQPREKVWFGPIQKYFNLQTLKNAHKEMKKLQTRIVTLEAKIGNGLANDQAQKDYEWLINQQKSQIELRSRVVASIRKKTEAELAPQRQQISIIDEEIDSLRSVIEGHKAYAPIIRDQEAVARLINKSFNLKEQVQKRAVELKNLDHLINHEYQTEK